MNKWILGSVALASLVGCAPPAKTPAEWNAKVTPLIDARKPQFMDCWKQEQARVVTLSDKDPEKKPLQDFLTHEVTIEVYLEVIRVSSGDASVLHTVDYLAAGNHPEAETLVHVKPGDAGEIDMPLHQCVEKAMTGLKPWDEVYPSRGSWKVVFQPGK